MSTKTASHSRNGIALRLVFLSIIVAVCARAGDWDFRAVRMLRFAKILLRDSDLLLGHAGATNVSFCALANKMAATDRGAKRA